MRLSFQASCHSRSLPSTSTFLRLLFYLVLFVNDAPVSAEDSMKLKDNHHHRIQDSNDGAVALGDLRSGYEHVVEHYAPEFLGLDRSIIGRAGGDVKILGNNAPGKSTISQGEIQFYTFPKQTLLGNKSPSTPGSPSRVKQRNFDLDQDLEAVELKRRQGDSTTQRTLYISLTTCDQPVAKSPNPDPNFLPDQLQLYISTSSSNQKPTKSDPQHAIDIVGGFGTINFTASDDVFFGISAPTNDQFTGHYNYELTASIDDFYASYHGLPMSLFIDSDRTSAMIYTNDTTDQPSNTSVFQEWMTRPPIFSLFVQNKVNYSVNGMQRSICALRNHAQLQGTGNINSSMTVSGGGHPKQQFYVTGLNSTSAYYMATGIIGNSTASGSGVVNGGGTVWKYTNFTTKSAPNCALIFNLTFCKDVAYAVPANVSNAGNITQLGQVYDDYTSSLYTNFSKSLQQIPCNTSSSARYSLTRNCDDCDNAYKQWLCAVSIPRCEDWSNNASYLQPRAINQSFINTTYGAQFANDPTLSENNKGALYMSSSRNAMIDSVIAPGPYKEVLPCQDLCYGLVQSCPAALQFSCPHDGYGLNYTYGSTAGFGPGQATCNFPGMVISAAASVDGTIRFAVSVAVIAMAMLVVV